MRNIALAALLVGGAWAGATLVHERAGDSAFSRRIAAGCEELEHCQSLEAEAEERVDRCSFACGSAATEYRTARVMRFRAEERRAVRDHYRERERVERLERDMTRATRLDDWQRREAARAGEAERDRRHQLELEQLRQTHADRRRAEERERRQSYYATLGREGRAKRLEHCLSANGRCDALVLDLLDAARDDAERRELARRNEGILPAPAKTPPAARGREAPEARAPAENDDAARPDVAVEPTNGAKPETNAATTGTAATSAQSVPSS
jgi:hypothetical protein